MVCEAGRLSELWNLEHPRESLPNDRRSVDSPTQPVYSVFAAHTETGVRLRMDSRRVIFQDLSSHSRVSSPYRAPFFGSPALQSSKLQIRSAAVEAGSNFRVAGAATAGFKRRATELWRVQLQRGLTEIFALTKSYPSVDIPQYIAPMAIRIRIPTGVANLHGVMSTSSL